MKTSTIAVTHPAAGASRGSSGHRGPVKGLAADDANYVQITCGHCGDTYHVRGDGDGPNDDPENSHSCDGRPCCPEHYERTGIHMGKLSSAARSKLPATKFAGPERSYPVPDKSHAANAKARATQAVKAGRMSKAQESKIDAKANKVLGKKGK